MKKKLTLIFGAISTLGLLSSCVPLAAGAAGGYLLHKKGYRVQSPIKKDEPVAPAYDQQVQPYIPPAEAY